MSVGFAPPAPPLQRPPRELLCEFHVERTHKFYRAELVDRGKWGVEAQILEAPETSSAATDFPIVQAARWAEMIRADVEAGYRETGD